MSAGAKRELKHGQRRRHVHSGPVKFALVPYHHPVLPSAAFFLAPGFAQMRFNRAGPLGHVFVGVALGPVMNQALVVDVVSKVPRPIE